MRYCVEQGCPNMVEKGRCTACAAKRERSRPNVTVRKWYGLPIWRGLRDQVRREEPYCRKCLASGYLQATTDVDHIEPHRGRWERFIDRTNLQGLCHQCHSRKTQAGA